jgi:predicted PurR-regulated permease PerM
MILAIVMIIVIHLIESYILNPRIYGTYMRINPVIVLIILTIGGKLFHIWGLILGVPVCTYIFGYAIKNNYLATTSPGSRRERISTVSSTNSSSN